MKDNTDQEIITSISESTKSDKYVGMEGYEVKTNRRTITVLIENGQHCCEEWGYCSSDDDLQGYIGAALLSISVTDDHLNTWDFEERYAGAAQFVTLATSKGVFQLAVYNWHSGYYGHAIEVKSGDEVLVDEVL